eukprot:TRINITY_DN1285_c0_g6_i1.p1 TRINITY_DN1285_c0_g6~~TRINITY_DN1285_c0_g6_i1.p1  ORF type:complete len:160 (+),score=34.17 TRINITY_DN1285_c0_g6_i1:58-537(+)
MANDDQAARDELLAKIKNAANGPELAQLQIKLLDQMVMQLKQRRMNVGQQIARDREELEWLEKERSSILGSLNPLIRERKEKEAQQKELEAKITECQTAFSAMLEMARSGLGVARKKNDQLQKNMTTFKLEQTRGYSFSPKAAKSTAKPRGSSLARKPP